MNYIDEYVFKCIVCDLKSWDTYLLKKDLFVCIWHASRGVGPKQTRQNASRGCQLGTIRMSYAETQVTSLVREPYVDLDIKEEQFGIVQT